MSTFKPRFESLVAIYDHATKSFPDRPLFGTKERGSWQWMTYGEFRKTTDQIRGGLAGTHQ